MPKVLTDGETSIGAYRFPDRKKIALCIERDNEIHIYGYFNSKDGANKFMNELGEMLGVPIEGAERRAYERKSG